MEITTQSLEALLHAQEQQAQLQRKNDTPVQGFDAILNNELGALAAPISMNSQTPSLGPVVMETAENIRTLDADALKLREAFDHVSKTLDLWDSYARTLGTSRTDTALRDAYGLLEGIDAQMAQLHGSDIRGKNAGMDSLLNELEIMSATEKIKFNRGDYLA